MNIMDPTRTIAVQAVGRTFEVECGVAEARSDAYRGLEVGGGLGRDQKLKPLRRRQLVLEFHLPAAELRPNTGTSQLY